MLARPALLLVALGLAAGAAHADGKAKSKQGVVSIDAVKDKLVVVRTDGGHYIVIEPMELRSDHFYFGDDKNLYRQRGLSGGANKKEQSFNRRFWAPRVQHQTQVERKDGAWSVTCGKRTTPLTEASEQETAKILGKATFHEPRWKRQGYALSRDDRGRYYYVDRLRDEHGGKGFRLFIGFKGKMKLTKLVNVVSDSEGDIFSTKKGDLRLIMNKDQGRASEVTWVKGKTRIPLKDVPLWENLVMIYDELGVYEGEQYGTPCDFY
jgi:hypothetical protein